ncbi:unnamed protein product [Rhizophagus irregularis]|uniref:Uncharacterized protein n=1 Tax=Rhizophagus irregularis TaxID=588596 RepID=A0A916EL51_9GLOM|nr:unnamed protein product [Rhizophagus irregularis]CAB5391957.1 unnamed protein product [Rhizophagus irregularis]
MPNLNLFYRDLQSRFSLLYSQKRFSKAVSLRSISEAWRKFPKISSLNLFTLSFGGLSIAYHFYEVMMTKQFSIVDDGPEMVP